MDEGTRRGLRALARPHQDFGAPSSDGAQPSPTGGDLTLTQVNDIRHRENERIFKMLKDQAEKLAMRRM